MNNHRITSLLCHLSFWFGVLFATPVFIAISNPEDIVLSPAAIGFWAGLVTLLVSVAGWKLSELAGTRAQWWINRALLALAFTAAIQGNVVHDLFYYGAFNGEKVDFRAYGPKFWVEWWGFIAILPPRFPAFYPARQDSRLVAGHPDPFFYHPGCARLAYLGCGILRQTIG